MIHLNIKQGENKMRDEINKQIAKHQILTGLALKDETDPDKRAEMEQTILDCKVQLMQARHRATIALINHESFMDKVLKPFETALDWFDIATDYCIENWKTILLNVAVGTFTLGILGLIALIATGTI